MKRAAPFGHRPPASRPPAVRGECESWPDVDDRVAAEHVRIRDLEGIGALVPRLESGILVVDVVALVGREDGGHQVLDRAVDRLGRDVEAGGGGAWPKG